MCNNALITDFKLKIMRKKVIFYSIIAMSMALLQSCGDFPPPEPTIPPCEWDENNKVVFYDLALHHPSGLSTYHKYRIPTDKVERSLVNVLELNGDGASWKSDAVITVKIIPDPSDCLGSKDLDFEKGDSEVSANTIDIPFVSNATFMGEVTVEIQTDVFINTVGFGNFYHVLWTSSGNDPNGNIAGKIYGKKLPYGNVDGTTSVLYIKEGMVLINGDETML